MQISKVIAEFRDEFMINSEGYELPEICFDSKYESEKTNDSAVLTLAIPVCNQAEIIESILDTLFQSLILPSKIILVLDACFDDTEIKIKKFLLNRNKLSEQVLDVTILKSTEDLFEATCEAICLKFTSTDYFVSLQSDIYMKDPTFFDRAIAAMIKFPDIAGISGKAVVPIYPSFIFPFKKGLLRSILNFPTRLIGKGPLFLGRFGSPHIYFGDVSRPQATVMRFSKRTRQTIFLGQSIIRGPILWRTSSLFEVGGINHKSYFLGWDDYDVSYRLWKVLNQRVGYLPSDCYSIPYSGTNSKPRTELADRIYSERNELAKRFPGELDAFWKNPRKESTDLLPPYEKRRI